MYNKGDLSFLSQPRFMHSETLQSVLKRVQEYISENALTSFQFILHGGEPLLLGLERMKRLLDEIHTRFFDKIELVISVQTNGVLLTEQFCKLFNKYGVLVSISMDGDKKINDLNRLNHKGLSSYTETLAGIKLGQRELRFAPAILTVLQQNESPRKIYDFFKSIGVKDWDVLLPDHNHDTLRSVSPDIGFWLIELFNIWYSDKLEKPKIRRFLNIIYLILGKKVNADTLGLELNKVLVIETNGEIEPIDVLKIEGHNFTKTNLNVLSNSFTDAYKNPLIKLYKESNRKVTKLCKSCAIYEVCGGGYLPHRYSSENKFNNRTVYCNDLMRLITHIQNRILEDLGEVTIFEAGLKKFSFNEVFESVYS